MRAYQGFTYIGLLIFIALMGVALAGTGVLGHVETTRAKEAELIFIGGQYRNAIGRYYERTPSLPKQYPRDLQYLIKDNRYPGTQRYMRKIYRDPMTGEAQWGIVRAVDGGIMGVYSLSDRSVMKVANFKSADRDFENSGTYADWKFVYAPPQLAASRVESLPEPVREIPSVR